MHAAVTIGSMAAIFIAHVMLIVEMHRDGAPAPTVSEPDGEECAP